MKKGIIFGILSVIIILIVIYMVLIIIGILPNPFLDTSDLVCTFEHPGSVCTEEVIFKFDNRAILKEYEENQINHYRTVEDSKIMYDSLIESINKLEEAKKADPDLEKALNTKNEAKENQFLIETNKKLLA